MKFRGPLFFSILVLTFLIAAFYPKATTDNADKDALLMRTILAFMDQLHFSPKQLDDELSEKIYDLYLDRIDGGHRFLTQKDLQQLENYRTQLDEEINSGSYAFFDQSVSLLQNGVQKAKAFSEEILATPFDFERDEKIELDRDDREVPANDEELRVLWRRLLKYETMVRLNRKLKREEEKGEEVEKKSFDELEKEVREDVREYYNDIFDRLSRLEREDRLSNYLNAITNVYDPHSYYYEPVEKENFNIRFSGKLEGIGARLQSEGDYTKVVDIVVGGPAWKNGQLQEGDLIMSVAQEGEDPVDITGMQINDVVQLIRGEKGTKVELTVKKVDGSTETIVITRDVVEFEERFAKSLILEDDEREERIGYIYLPGFYADFEDRNGRFSSEDIKKEINKMKEESVDGIILDLRDNTGGSLRDVIKISGYFIEKGPIVQVKSRAKKPEVLTDTDQDVLYDGPLAVMVNSFSASASEILASALQDYGRAIIVGSDRTFGKGTVQRFFNLDRAVRGHDEMKPLGDLKVTTQKFYRIDGGSTQLRGVQPDIILPDNYHYIEIGERENEYAIQWTEIDPVDYEQNVYQIDELETIQKRSRQRVDTSTTFQKIYQNARLVEEQREQSVYPLNFDSYREFKEEEDQKAKEYRDLFDAVVIPDIRNLEADTAKVMENEAAKVKNRDFIESVSKDIYVQETMNVLHDLLKTD